MSDTEPGVRPASRPCVRERSAVSLVALGPAVFVTAVHGRRVWTGTLELLERLEPGSAFGATLGPVKAVIYRQDRAADARLIAEGIRQNLVRLHSRFSVLDTVVHHAKAYKEAATLRIPVHRHERRRGGVMPSACVVMHQLAWELIPDLKGVYAGKPQRREHAS